MGSTRKDPREMTDEETMRWMRELVDRLALEKGSAGGACSLEALKNPIRRNILNILEERPLEMKLPGLKARVSSGLSGFAGLLRFAPGTIHPQA